MKILLHLRVIALCRKEILPRPESGAPAPVVSTPGKKVLCGFRDAGYYCNICKKNKKVLSLLKN